MTDVAPRPYRINDRFTAERDTTVMLTGVQALARLPVEQLRADRRDGRNTAAFISGYPGSPLGGFDSAAARAAKLNPDLDIVCTPGTNEELGASAVMGSQLASTRPDATHDGVVGLWYAKAPGVDRALDALRHAVFAGTSRWGGAVALVGDDPNAKSSSLPNSSAGVLGDLHIPVLYPADAGEVLELGRHAIALSRFTGLWTALKIVADVADGIASVGLDLDRVRPVTPALFDETTRRQPDGRLLTPHTIELEQEIYEVRYPLAVNYASANRLNHVTVDPADAWIGIAASGVTYRELREALQRLGLGTDAEIEAAGIRLLRMQMPLPFDPDTVRRFAQGLDTVLVVEEKMPILESLIKDALYHQPDRPKVIGKTDEVGTPLLPWHAQIGADHLAAPLRKVLEARLAERLAPLPRRRELIPLLTDTERAPFFCSGCPHNRSTEIPEGSLAGVGIGCHGMTLLMDPSRVGGEAGLTCMGNEGSQWIGMSPFVETPHMFQNLGDGTYFHSGQLAVQAAVAAGVTMTYKLLHNGTVAMTGGQHPEGQMTVPDICTSLLAHGVTKVLITTDEPERYGRALPGPAARFGRIGGDTLPAGVEVWDRSRLIEAQEHLAGIEGVTVLVHDQGCAAELRRGRKRGTITDTKPRVAINHRICEGCGDCGQVSNCLSVEPVETEFGRKTAINQTTCNLDASCVEGDCPSFMTIELDDDATRSPASASASAPISPPEVPTPGLVVPADEFSMRITGIGGTGIVTVSQVLATAAMLDGFEVLGLDQIGLSQKAGPVVSDVRLSKSGSVTTNKLGRGQADLLLACDQLVAATDKGRMVCEPGHTVVVGSTTSTPTGHQITHPEIASPTPDALAAAIAEVSDGERHHWADAGAITTSLFGDAVMANIFCVGMAVQAGALPIGIESIEAAINLNGVAVETNLAAFRWGRVAVARPDALPSPITEGTGAPTDVPIELGERIVEITRALGRADLDPMLRRRAHDLVGFQNQATAVDYLDELLTVARREAGLELDGRLTEAVAIGLHKVIAYKDEYEVARLMTDDDGLAEALKVAGEGGRISWKLHPPMLRALGMDSKIDIPLAAAPAIRKLAAGKRLRGTRLDPFGRAEVRVAERKLRDDYRALVGRLVAALTADNHERAVEVAGLIDHVRGYEDLKLRRIAEYEERLAAIS